MIGLEIYESLNKKFNIFEPSRMNLKENTYLVFLQEVKTLIRQGHQKAASSVNAALLKTYWNLGKRIAQQQSLFEGRNNYIDTLARDLKLEFPSMTGFSKRNLFDIRRFYLFYASLESSSNYANDSVRQPVALKKDNEQSPVQQVVALRDVNKPIGVSEFNCQMNCLMNLGIIYQL